MVTQWPWRTSTGRTWRGWSVALALAGGGSAPALAQQPVTAFVDVSVVPMDRERVLAHQTVLVRGDRIAAIGPAAKVRVPAEAKRVDARGKFLMPGLGDMHVHFAMFGLVGRFALDTTVDIADALFSFVANGVTTVRDMHSGPDWQGNHWLLAVRRRVRSGELLGPRIYAAGDPDGSSPEAGAKSVEALKAAGYDFVKLYGSPRPFYDSVVVAARRVGLPVVGHVPPDVGIPGVLLDRWASIEHMGIFSYLDYADTLTSGGGTAAPGAAPRPPSDAVVRRLAAATQRAGIWICPTVTVMGLPASAPRSVMPEDARNFLRRLLKAFGDARVNLLLGTDLGTDAFYLGRGRLSHGFHIHRELEGLVELGLTPYQALETGTRNVARFLGTDDSSGTVSVGKRADLLLLKRNPLTDIRNTTAIAGVMVGGRWLSREELDRRIDTLPSVVKPDAQAAEYGSTAIQMRLLRDLLWR